MASRLLNPHDQYRDDEGVICAGGSLVFSLTGTSTAKDVFGERALSTNLGATVDLDASGRPESDIWLASDALYRVRLLNADDEQVWSRDDVGDADSGGLVPLDPADGDEDDVYRTDGTDAYWGPIREVPDPTGHSGKRLGTDGELVFWETQETFDADNLPGGVLDESAYYQIGNTMIQRGSGTAATNGTNTVTAAVTFSPAFDSTTNLCIQITITSGPTFNASGWITGAHALSKTASGFTASFRVNGEDVSASEIFDSSVTFDWEATGPREP